MIRKHIGAAKIYLWCAFFLVLMFTLGTIVRDMNKIETRLDKAEEQLQQVQKVEK